jgi:autotransporter-associated beta strand protein
VSAGTITPPIAFTNGDAVTFNDSSSVTSVNVSTTLLPISVTVNSSSNGSNYTFSGTGSIAGSASLTKLGTSTLTINNANTYTGATNVSGGTLINAISSGSGIGTGPLTIAAGATLQIGDGTDTGTPASGNLIGSSSITNNGTIVYAGRPDYTAIPVLSAPVIGTGGITVTSGVLGMGYTNNAYSGAVTVIGTSSDIEAYEASSLGTGLVTSHIDPGGTGGVDLSYAAFTYTNAFNLSGYALQTYGGNYTTTITGPVHFYDIDVTLALAGSLVLTNNVIATNNQNLIVTNHYGYSNSLTFGGNVSLGTGTISSQGFKLIFAPPISTTSTITTGGIQNLYSAAAVQQNGLGTTVLNGSNTYTGGTTVSAGTLVFNTPNALPTFSALTISASATAQAALHTGTVKNTLFTSSLTLDSAGKLDLTNNDLVVQSGSLSAITAAVKQGYNGGGWNGSAGITSSAAAAATSHLLALGVIQNSNDQTTTGSVLYGGTFPAFDGATASAATDVLVKFTYYGDANLDGQVDGSDYTLIDNGFHNHLTGWYNGDFNYDGVVDGSDYTLIDNAFNTQGAVIASQFAGVSALSTAQLAGNSGSSSAVPEPASFGILALCASASLRRRRRA